MLHITYNPGQKNQEHFQFGGMHSITVPLPLWSVVKKRSLGKLQ